MDLPNSLCFVDIETSGLSASYNKIIEIGVLKVENGTLVKEFNTLVNPHGYIDPFIESMTGINAAELENAPDFYEIKDELLELLADSVFVAHNVRFDYGFIRNEFKRIGISYTSKHFCTVKLAKLLYPNQKKYNLDAIIENFNLECKNRHRAYDDAKVLFDFYEQSRASIKPELFSQAVSIVMKRPSLPSAIPPEFLDTIPENPGVYIFYGENGTVLYIGKSINIRDRVLSHFSNDHLSSTDMKISQQIRSIEFIETAGELGALLLESTLIKKHQPAFNRLLRNSRRMPILLKATDKNGYNTVRIEELQKIDESEIGNILGVFRTQKQLKEFLYKISKEYFLCTKIFNLDKSSSYCFNFHLGQCLGACNGDEISLKYNLRFDEAFYKSKIRPWRFDHPILIREEGDRQEAHVVDKWCYLGSLKNEEENLEDLSREYVFDYDTYKILNRFLMDPKNEKKIKILVS